MKKVIITGVTGQDGSYMADYLLKLGGYQVLGAVRRVSVKNYNNIHHLKDVPNFSLIDMDVSDPISVTGAIQKWRPDYFINFAANSFVGNSWEMPVNHFQTNTMGVLYQLEAIRMFCPNCRYYNAGSSEEFGDVDYSPQDEEHPLKPRSPYGASKASARHIVKVYRESYGLYAVQGWLFNHESERRGVEFVTRKITKGVARIAKQIKNAEEQSILTTIIRPQITPIFIGNINARRDWSHAEDFVDGIWRMLNQEVYNEDISYNYDNTGFILAVDDTVGTKYLSENIKDYVLSSMDTHSVRNFIEEAFKVVGIKGEWEGGESESMCFRSDGMILAEVDPKFYRPNEVQLLYGDSSAAREELGWEPKTSFEELVKRMVEHDMV